MDEPNDTPRLTRRERAENRLERRLDWADGREAKATQARDASLAITEHIPFGQPILVGHHSEKRHRNALGRAQSLASKTVEHANMADHHRSKADGIKRQLDHSIYSDDHDAIQRLEERIASLEAERDRIKAYNKTCRKGATHGDLSLLDEEQRSKLASYAQHWPAGLTNGRWPDLTNLGANIRRNRQRLEQLRAKEA